MDETQYGTISLLDVFDIPALSPLVKQAVVFWLEIDGGENSLVVLYTGAYPLQITIYTVMIMERPDIEMSHHHGPIDSQPIPKSSTIIRY